MSSGVLYQRYNLSSVNPRLKISVPMASAFMDPVGGSFEKYGDTLTDVAVYQLMMNYQTPFTVSQSELADVASLSYQLSSAAANVYTIFSQFLTTRMSSARIAKATGVTEEAIAQALLPTAICQGARWLIYNGSPGSTGEGLQFQAGVTTQPMGTDPSNSATTLTTYSDIFKINQFVKIALPQMLQATRGRLVGVKVISSIRARNAFSFSYAETTDFAGVFGSTITDFTAIEQITVNGNKINFSWIVDDIFTNDDEDTILLVGEVLEAPNTFLAPLTKSIERDYASGENMLPNNNDRVATSVSSQEELVITPFNKQNSQVQYDSFFTMTPGWIQNLQAVYKLTATYQ